MIEYWQRLSARERLLVAVMSAVIFISLIYLLALRPFWHSLTQAREQYQQNLPLVNYLSHATPTIKALEKIDGKQINIQDSELLTTLEESLNSSVLIENEKTIRQSDNSTVEIKWNAVPFDQLTDWIDSLWRTYTIHVIQLQVTPTPVAGVVKAVCVLQNKKAPQNVGLKDKLTN